MNSEKSINALRIAARSLDGKVNKVDPSSMTVFTEFEEHQGDVINVIPPQLAGEIARRTDG